MRLVSLLGAAVLAAAGASLAPAQELAFRDVELPTRLTVGYAVRIVDMNAEQRPDIAIVDSHRILWLENPNWNEHVILDKQTRADNVCFADADIDGDGQVDFAIGADWKPFNTASGGTIQWIGGKSPTEPWKLHPIGEEPTVHRMNFADLDGDGRPELIVAPLMGRGTKGPGWSESGVRLLAYPVPQDPIKGPWEPKLINDELHVTHNFQVTDFNHDKKPDIVIVSFEGVHLLEQDGAGNWQRTRIGTGNQETSPNKGASEIKHGRLADGDYVATIEPWHGHQVVVYTRPDGERPERGKEWLWKRHVLDEELKWGHAVWCANLDDDDDEELIIGVRDDLDSADKNKRRGLRIYDPSEGGTKWKRYIVDPGSVAIEDAAAGDLNGDGKTDIVAVGRQTHNVKIYFNQTK